MKMRLFIADVTDIIADVTDIEQAPKREGTE